jgi:hypothetical protein
MKALILPLLAFSLLSPIALGQSPPSSSTAGKATVYVYRYRPLGGRTYSAGLYPSVYCDEIELARLPNGRYLVAQIEPGEHVFRSNQRGSGILLDLKPGGIYYLRLELVNGLLKSYGRLAAVDNGIGAAEVKKTELLAGDRLKEHKGLVIAPGAPANVAAPTGR